jgi:MerR family Zn(II)-responsive transcriptional regulator of zntA
VRIGEVAAASGTTPKTLRYYEDVGLLPPPARTSGGYRDYPPETLARMDFIRRSRAAGLTLARTREILDIRDAGQPPCSHVEDLLAAQLATLDAQIADLTVLRDTVAELHEAVAAADPSECNPATICEYL